MLLAADGTPKVSDFGLAKKLDESGQTGSGALLGTPSYMAPEQAAGQNRTVGPPADVYALGAILYECQTGRPPFKAATRHETIQLVLSAEPVPPGVVRFATKRGRRPGVDCGSSSQHDAGSGSAGGGQPVSHHQ